MHGGLWIWITPFGDSAILLPVELLIAAGLLIRRVTRRSGRWWLGVVLVSAVVVATTKLIYMAWGWRAPGLDFIGLSGDSATAFLFWPVAAAYTGARWPRGWRRAAFTAGCVLALLVAISRVVTFAHSVSEAVGGSLCGMLAATVFLGAMRGKAPAPRHLAWVPVAVLILGLLWTAQRPRPIDLNGWLANAAMRLSGHSGIYTRCDLGAWAALQPGDRSCVPQRPETGQRAGGSIP